MKGRTKLTYASLGKSGKRMEHSSSTDHLKAPQADSVTGASPRPQVIYQSVMHEMDNEQSQYIDALLRSKRAAKGGPINCHQRASSDINLVRHAEEMPPLRRQPRERHTYDAYQHQLSGQQLLEESCSGDQLEIYSVGDQSDSGVQLKSMLGLESCSGDFLRGLDHYLGKLACPKVFQPYSPSPSRKKSEVQALRELLSESEEKLKQMEMVMSFQAKKHRSKEDIARAKLNELTEYVAQLEECLEQERSEKRHLRTCLMQLQGKIDQVHQTNKQIKVRYDQYQQQSLEDSFETDSCEPVGRQRYTANGRLEDKENLQRAFRKQRSSNRLARLDS